jgi:ABC-type transporter Mla subunit MlaD
MKLPLLLLFALALPAVAHPQQDRSPAMSDAEIEKIRDAAFIPVDRINAYVTILNDRSKRLQDLVSKPRRPGRERDLHDMCAQFGDIVSELADNLDDLDSRHRDLRRVLPHLLDGTERWATTLQSPADDPQYRTARRLALAAVHDLHDAVVAAQAEQAAYFKAHPDAASKEQQRLEPGHQANEPFDIPR